MARPPTDLKHFLVQNPGAEHNDAVDVYHRVVAAVQELGRLLFTVQDQGDILLVDAESDSVPPAKKQTARAGDGGQASPQVSLPEVPGDAGGTRSLQSRSEPSRCGQTGAGTSPHRAPRETPCTQVRSVASGTRSAVQRGPETRFRPRAGRRCSTSLRSIPAPNANAGCGGTESARRWGRPWACSRLSVRSAELTS